MKKCMLSLVLVVAVLIPNVFASEKGTDMTLHPEFPVVEGDYQMTKDWKVTLPMKFNRRIEEGSLVIWRPGFTIWISVWNNDQKESLEDRLKWISNGSSKNAYDRETEKCKSLIRYSYRLKVESEDERQAAFYCFAIGKNGHVQIAIYFDNPKDISMAKAIWRSLVENNIEG